MIDYNRMRSLYVIDDLDIVIDEKFQEFDALLRESYDLEAEMVKGNFSYSQMIVKVETMKDNAAVHQSYLNDFFVLRDRCV